MNEQQQILLEDLKHEFQHILFHTHGAKAIDALKSLNSISISTSLTDSASITLHYEDYVALHGVLSTEDVEGLREIAEMLDSMSTDCLRDCVQVYIKHRKNNVNMIYGLLQTKTNIAGAVGDFKYTEGLSEKIQQWIQVAKICIGKIFVKEKSLYDQTFGGLGTAEDAGGYVHIIGGAAVQLLKFPDSLMASPRLPDRLEILLPLYKEMLNFMPIVDKLFTDDLCVTKNIHGCISRIMCQFTQHMARILSASERHIIRELSRFPIPGGTIHPTTEYVVQYIGLISNHSKILTDVICKSHSHGLNDMNTLELDSLEMDQEPTPLKFHVTRIIQFLLYNLKYKSNFYDEESLGHLFMMNNVHCVAQKIRSSLGLQEIIGNSFLMKLTEKVEQEMKAYLKTTWDEVCYCLRDEGRKWWSCCSGKSKRAVKKRLKTFNHLLEYVHQTQVKWLVPDKQLREMLHKSILDKLIPAYSNFLDQFSDKVKHLGRHKKYSVKDLEGKVMIMFFDFTYYVANCDSDY